jgi:predicted enzyme related to lactoylglutathione lyase
MKKRILITFSFITTFALGFAFKSLVTDNNGKQPLKRVTGIGGIFFKCKDPKKVREWYKTHLGLNTNDYGAVFEWRQAADSTKKGYTEWNPFPDSTTYFNPSQEYMINYRVDNLDALVNEFKKEGVTIADTVETYEYGKFVHVIDVEGNKIELWQPNDIQFEKLGNEMGAKTTK